LKKEFSIEDEWLPLEIHPETPKEGTPITKLFPKDSLERMYASLKNAGEQYGIDFRGNDLLSNSHLSLAAGEFAKEKDKFEEYHERVFHAYFSEKLDIGDTKVLTSIIDSIGLDSEEMERRFEDGTYESILKATQETAHKYDIRSTPTFIIDGKYAIVGAQPIEVFRQALLEIEKQ